MNAKYIDRNVCQALIIISILCSWTPLCSHYLSFHEIEVNQPALCCFSRCPFLNSWSISQIHVWLQLIHRLVGFLNFLCLCWPNHEIYLEWWGLLHIQIGGTAVVLMPLKMHCVWSTHSCSGNQLKLPTGCQKCREQKLILMTLGKTKN